MKKKAHNGIVDEFLERINWRALEDYRANVKEMIHGHAGVYALYKGEKLYYVGLARNLMSRVNQHLKDRHKSKWDTFSVYLTISVGLNRLPPQPKITRNPPPIGVFQFSLSAIFPPRDNNPHSRLTPQEVRHGDL